MSAKLVQPLCHTLLILLVATMLSLAAIYSPILLDEVLGTTITAQAYACQPSGGSCG